MPTNIPIPKLGQSEETVTIESWKVKEGDKVSKGDILFDVETDKAVLEVESQFEGTILKIIVPEGKEVPVMSIAAVIGEPGEEIPNLAELQPKELPKPAPEPSVPTQQEGKKGAPVKAETTPATTSATPTALLAPPPVAPSPAVQAFRPKPTPRARKFAEDYLINLDKVPGTGGAVNRVTEADVRKYLETTGYADRKVTPAAFNVAQEANLDLLEIEGTGDRGRVTLHDVQDAIAEKAKEFTAMRKVIASRLTQSKQQIPHFYVTTSVDMTEVGKRRKALKEVGIALSVNDFIMKAVALALKEFPALNASTDGITYSYRSKVHIGVAVSVDNGLVVPVVRNADKKELDEIHAEVTELAGKARDGKLQPDDMKGGTFTISNMGMLNVENFAAIINPGESAILAVSSTAPTPVVIDNEITIRDMMKITVSADHRIVDGAMGANFVNGIKAKLEDSEYWNNVI